MLQHCPGNFCGYGEIFSASKWKTLETEGAQECSESEVMAACVRNTPIGELCLWLSPLFAAVPCATPYLVVPSPCPPCRLGRGAAPGIAGHWRVGSLVSGRTHLAACPERKQGAFLTGRFNCSFLRVLLA